MLRRSVPIRSSGVERIPHDDGEIRAARGTHQTTGNNGNLGASVRIRDLTKVYVGVPAIANIDLDIAAGEFVTLLGPSGSGKTTMMMAIAGFVENYSGEIEVGGRLIDHLPAHRRDIGIVFQNLALFPHMTVLDNIAFPLRMRAVPAAQVQQRARAVTALVKLTGLEGRLPSQLSGGQQQRVALARAIVFNPPILLLDEPLGALDRKLRENMQLELLSLHKRLGLTVIHVTHDQSEAMAMSDRIAVINAGRIEQFGTPQELYTRPINRFVANFVGESVFIEGLVEEVTGRVCRIKTRGGLRCVAQYDDRVHPNSDAVLMLRPEQFFFGVEASIADNQFVGEIRTATFIGDRIRYEISISEADRVIVSVPNRTGATLSPAGQRAQIGWKLDDAILFRSG